MTTSLSDAGLTFADGSQQATAGKTEPYIYLREEVATNAAGGTPVTGTWTSRNLNTKTHDANSLATLSSGQVVLSAGTYRFKGSSFIARSGQPRMRLYNVTDSLVIGAVGPTEFADTFTASIDVYSGKPSVRGRFTIAAGKSLALQYFTNGAFATYGLGYPSNIAGVNECYAELELWKEVP